jgi:tetratricopeptide (TPR) repeat protein
LPSMLLFVPFAEFIIWAIDYFSYKKIIQFIVAFVIVIILFGEGDITYNRNKIFSDDFILWFDNVDKSPRLSRPHANMGRTYFLYNKKETALQEYKKAMILNNYGNREILAIQRCNLGLLYFEMMKDELAMDCFRKSSEILPEYFQNYIYMAKIKLRHNKIKEAKDIVEDKLKKYRSDPAVLELYSLVLLKDGRINASQYFAKKLLAKNADSLPALAIMAETCRIKNNYAGAISYWKSVRSVSPQNALSNLALIELYRKINYTEKLEQEIRLLFYLQGSLTLNEYIKKLTKDENLIIYVPKIDNYSFITRQFCHIN